jgi:hypothetical protein
METKYCKLCDDLKPISEFYASPLHRVGKGELNHYKGWKCEYNDVTLT